MFLTANEKLTASIVCRRWLNAMDDQELLSGICVTVQPKCSQVWHKKWIGGKYVYWSRRFQHHSFKDIDFTPEVLEYLNEYGKYIQTLTLRNCKINPDQLQSSLERSYCCNIQELIFANCFVDIFHNLPSLKILSIDCYDYVLTDYVLFSLNKAISRLETFYLFISQTVHSSDEMIKEIYGDTVSHRQYASKTSLTFPALLSFIKSNSATLSDLDFDGIDNTWKSALYNEFLNITNFELRKLTLDRRYLEDTSVDNLLAKFNTITELALIFCDKNNNPDAVCRRLPNLKSLTIENSQVSDLKIIFSLRDLQSLKLINVNFLNLTNESLEEALGVYRLNELKHFELQGTNMKAKMVRCLLERMTELNCLSLGGNGLTVKTLRFISEHLVGLSELEIFFNPRTNAVLTAKSVIKLMKFPRLHTLRICPLKNVTDTLEEILLLNNPCLYEVAIHEDY